MAGNTRWEEEKERNSGDVERTMDQRKEERFRERERNVRLIKAWRLSQNDSKHMVLSVYSLSEVDLRCGDMHVQQLPDSYVACISISGRPTTGVVDNCERCKHPLLTLHDVDVIRPDGQRTMFNRMMSIYREPV